jgi:hypothetical protein
MKPGMRSTEAAEVNRSFDMKSHRNPSRPCIRIVNLKVGMPAVHQALSRLDQELSSSRLAGSAIVKIIHGYGSTGAGGDIRLAVQRRLTEMAHDGQIRNCILGENWSKSDEETWKLLQDRAELKTDSDLGRKNHGITVVVL